MSKRVQTHLRGQRGQAFADKIRDVKMEQLLCVSLDISKYFHVVMIHNGLGEIVKPTFEIDIFRSGYERLCEAIDQALVETKAKVLLMGMEPTSHYFENLARHLQLTGYEVSLINSYAVKLNREQQMMRREKSDPIDAAAIGDLLRRGEGSPYRPLSGVYLQLQQLERVRLSKVKMCTMLKNQIIGHLDRIFPGLVIVGQGARQRYEPLFATDFWQCQTLQNLIRVCPDPRRLAQMGQAELISQFHQYGYKMGPKMAAKIIAYAQKALWPDAQLVAIRNEALQHDLQLFDAVQTRLSEFDQRLQALLEQTPYLVWTKLKGLSYTQVISLAAAIGDPNHYDHAKQVFRRSGLVSGRNDSGTRQKQGQGSRILKSGDVYLRRALMNATETLILHQPVLAAYFGQLRSRKPNQLARVATARRANGILWATLRDQRADKLILKRGAAM